MDADFDRPELTYGTADRPHSHLHSITGFLGRRRSRQHPTRSGQGPRLHLFSSDDTGNEVEGAPLDRRHWDVLWIEPLRYMAEPFDVSARLLLVGIYGYGETSILKRMVTHNYSLLFSRGNALCVATHLLQQSTCFTGAILPLSATPTRGRRPATPGAGRWVGRKTR